MGDETGDSLIPKLFRLYVPVMIVSLALPAVFGLILALLIFQWWALIIPMIFVAFSALHLLWLYVRSQKKLKQQRDFFEMKLPAEDKVKLREFVFEIARRWDTPRPEDIRLSAISAAHVYESKKGKRILVIGGMSLASLSREALGAVVAHELNHFAAGDTAQHWEHLSGFTTVSRLGEQFRRELWHLIDPAAWPVFAFQLYVELRLARHSRECEFRCDVLSAEHAGPAATAAALVYLHVIDEMPWANTMDVLAMDASVGATSNTVFSEQAARAASATFRDWSRAAKSVMNKGTGAWDSHPCLADRLDAIGASLEDGLNYLLDDTGKSARTLLNDWRAIERKLSVTLTSAYQMWRENRYGWGGLSLGDPDD
jgi:Zn-dependent protease with chaperone function